MTQQSSTNRADSVREQIAVWLRDYGYDVAPIVRDQLRWGLTGSLKGDPGIGVGMPRAHPDRVFFQLTYQLEQGFRDRVALLEPDARRDLILDLRLLLVTLPAGFLGAEEPLERVNVFVNVFTENIRNRTIVNDTILQVHRSYSAVSWFLQRRFPEVQIDADGENDPKPHFVN